MDINSKYYTNNIEAFIENTLNCDMSNQYHIFLKYMPNKGTILDLGFGSGRDMMHFQSLGYNVKGIDPIESFVERMLSKGFDVSNTTAQSMDFKNEFDGIWACASLLHVPSNELSQAFKKCETALKDNGILYCSFKYGTYEGERNGRVFTDLNEETIQKYLDGLKLNIIETSITTDVRPDQSNQKWLNCVIKKG